MDRQRQRDKQTNRLADGQTGRKEEYKQGNGQKKRRQTAVTRVIV